MEPRREATQIGHHSPTDLCGSSSIRFFIEVKVLLNMHNFDLENLNSSTTNLPETWTFLVKSGIINTDDVLDKIMASKKEQVKKLHTFTITPPSKEGGRWQTYYKDSAGKRKIIRAQNEDELLEKLIPIYLTKSNIDKMTFHKLYEEWLIYKTSVTNSMNTITRHKQHYRKYLESSVLDQKPINRIDDLLLETECNRIVREFNLPRKEWGNVKTIINGMFEYAVRKKYLTENPLKSVKILVKFKQVVRKTGKTETFNTDELKDLNQYLDRMYSETHDSAYLAVKLNFLLGMRIGELVALKWSDRSDEHHFHVVREEIRNQETGLYQVVDHTKTNTDRFVVLVPKALELLKKLEPVGEYLFMREGERLTSRQIAYVLEKYAERQGVATKSTHKMRKTYASNLNAAGVPLDCIREQLGHTNLNTTLTYIYNPLTEKETYDLIAKAL